MKCKKCLGISQLRKQQHTYLNFNVILIRLMKLFYVIRFSAIYKVNVKPRAYYVEAYTL